MKIFIILTVTLASAWGQLQQGQAYYPYPSLYPVNYPYGYPGYPFAINNNNNNPFATNNNNNYPFTTNNNNNNNPFGINNNNNYPFTTNNNNNYPYYPSPPQIPIRGDPPPIISPPIVPVPVVDIVPQGITGSVPLSPLEAALTQLDHRNKGHSEKYFYGRHGLGPEGPLKPLKPKPDPSPRARHNSDYLGGGNVNYNYNGNYPGVDYSYNYNYPQYQYPQYYPQVQPQYQYQYPQYQYPYNSYYPDNTNVNVNDNNPVGILADPYIGVKKPLDGEVNLNVNGGKKPFSVKKPEHYELYTYHR